MTLDFTFKRYEELCNIFTKRNIFTVKSYIEKESSDNILILRHDVDRNLANALNMALLENKFNIKSTYYFRVNSQINANLIKKIYNLNHEIGYHYEVLAKTKGDYQKAINLFERELNFLRTICEIDTICMHGSPISNYNNLKLWDKYDFQKYNIIGDASLSIRNIYYITDSGRSWDRTNNLRDYLPYERKPLKIIKNSNELIHRVNNTLDNFYINIHPERWSLNTFNYLQYYIKDQIYNIGKKTVKIKNDLI